MSVLNLLGWVGAGLGAAAYVLVSTRRILPNASLFQGMNVIGAALLGVAAFHSGALPSASMNIAWVLFGMHSLAMANQRRRAAPVRPLAEEDAAGAAGLDRVDVAWDAA